MVSKKLRRFEDIKEKKSKKSTRMIYFSVVMAGVLVVIIMFFVFLFNAIFPPVDMEAMKRKERKLAIIWFSDAQEHFLVAEKRYVFKENDSAQQAKEIVKALLDGSKTGKINTFPAGVTVWGVKVDDKGTAYVNFSKSLLKLHPGGSTAEMATIYSLTNSITENVSSIRKVKILVEGREISSIKGHISTKKEYSRNPDITVPVKEEEERN